MAARNQTLLAHLPGIEDRLQRVLELPRRVELIGTRERAAVRERIAQGDVGGVLRVVLVRAQGDDLAVKRDHRLNRLRLGAVDPAEAQTAAQLHLCHS